MKRKNCSNYALKALICQPIITLSSGDASDSICPKGWGMAGTSGDGSYQKLIRNVYVMNKINSELTQKYKEYNIFIRPDSIMSQLLLIFIQSGYYNLNGYISRGLEGDFWINKAYADDRAYVSYFNSRILRPQGTGIKNYGHSVRCVATFFR